MTAVGFYEKITSIFTGGEKVPGLPIAETGFVVLDTELTGLDVKTDSILSIGAVRMKGSSIELGNVFYKLVRPEAEISRESVVIHGITPSEVAGQEPIDKAIPELCDFCGTDVIVGHFIGLDMSFINREMKRIKNEPCRNPVVDTCKLFLWMQENNGSFGRHYSARQDDLDLFSLARQHQVPISEGHNALSDAFITAQLFQRFLSSLSVMGVKTIRDLLRIGRA